MTIKAFATKEVKGALQPFQYEPQPLGAQEVEIQVTHCGICYSDIHLIDNDWGVSSYPLVPGHEVVGTIIAVGSDVKRLQPGQRVGVGWQSGSCHDCEWCNSGQENLCSNLQPTCVGKFGGFADRLRTDSRFAFVIPEGLSSENAAPLLCAGVTMYSPLRHYNIKPIHKVGIIGIGGLGHLGIQFAAAMGCEVTAFSTSPDKADEAKKLGATHFISSSNAEQMKGANNSLDFIIATADRISDWQPFVDILRPNGILCIVSGGEGDIQIGKMPLLFGQKVIAGSLIGGRAIMQEMLEFAARHNIKAQTEVVPMAEVNQALDKVRKNRARYRMVLQN